MTKVADTSLRAPVTPKLADVDAERVRREHEAKIIELQGLVRKLIEAS
jgi:hypothetical protein